MSDEIVFAREFGKFVTEWDYERFPTDVVQQTKLSILDTIGVTVRGSVQASTAIVRDISVEMGGKDESTLLGTGEKVPSLSAAFVNGTSAHSLELDDHISHKRSLGHPGVVSLPAALALGEAVQASGKDFIAAYIHGYEVTSRLNDVVPTGFDNFTRGFHGTAITGTFGAAALSGKLLGSDVDQIASAIGICGTMTSGSFEYNKSGAWTKRLHAGHSSRNGLMAALMAHRGYTGPHTAIEGRHGFLNSYFGPGNYDSDLILKDLGEDWVSRHIMYKPFSCSGVLHSPITSTKKVMTENGIDYRDIERIVVHTSSTIVTEMTNPRERRIAPQTTVDAQFSLPYAVAVMAVRGKALLNEFNEETIADPEVRKVAALVEFYVDPEIEKVWPTEEPSTVRVFLKDGRELSASVPGPKGGLEVPMSAQELEEKFVDLVSPVLGESRASDVIQAVASLEDFDDVRDLTPLLYAS